MIKTSAFGKGSELSTALTTLWVKATKFEYQVLTVEVISTLWLELVNTENCVISSKILNLVVSSSFKGLYVY